MNTVKDVMIRDTFACHEEDSIRDVIEYLCRKRVSGVPVVNDDNEVVGFISETDILKHVQKKTPLIVGAIDATISFYDDESFDEHVDDLMDMEVMELASLHPICASPDDEIESIAHLMFKKKIKKLAVTENGVLVGVISQSMIIRYIMNKILERCE